MKAKNRNQARQGDIFFEKIDVLPSGKHLMPHGNRVIAYGEVTGHAHQVTKDTFKNVDILVDQDGNMFLKTADTGESVEVEHDEHGTISLDPDSIYAIGSQREYDPLAVEMERRVAD